MASDSTVKVNFVGDTSSLKQATDDADGHLSRLGDSVGKFAKVAAVGFAAGTLALGAFAKSAVGHATDLGESMNAVDKIFGDQANTIKDWGKANANAFGLTRAEFNQLATPLGALLKNSGIQMDKVSGHTIELTKRAADLASVFNVDVSEAMEAINSGLKGEADPLEKFGIGLSAAKVEAQALAETGKKSAKALTEQEKATARINLIMKESASVQGDFAGTSDQLANKTRILKARFTDFQAELGAKLIPIALTLANILGDKVLPVLSSLAERVMPVLASFAREVALAFHLVAGGFETSDRTSSGFHGKMEQLGVILRSVFEWAKDNIPPVLAAIAGFIREQVIPAIQSLVGWVQENLVPALGKMAASFKEEIWPIIEQKVIPALIKLADFIRDKVLPVLGKIVVFIVAELIPAFFKVVNWISTELIPAIANVVEWFVNLGTTIYTFATNFGKFVAGFASDLAGWVVDVWRFGGDVLKWFRDLPGEVLDVFSGAAGWLWSAGVDVLQGLWDGLKSLAPAIWNWVSDFAGKIASKIKDALKVWSPSRVMMEVGENIMEGLQVGMGSGAHDVLSTAGAIASGIPLAISQGGPGSVPVAPFGMGSSSGGGATFNFNGPVVADKVTLEQMLVEALSSARRRGWDT